MLTYIYINLSWIRAEYNNPEVVITENGWAEDAMDDLGRVEFIQVITHSHNYF